MKHILYTIKPFLFSIAALLLFSCFNATTDTSVVADSAPSDATSDTSVVVDSIPSDATPDTSAVVDSIPSDVTPDTSAVADSIPSNGQNNIVMSSCYDTSTDTYALTEPIAPQQLDGGVTATNCETYEIGMIVRDFNSNHPDFEYPISPGNNPCKADPLASVGMVKDVLPPNKRPEKAKDMCKNSKFEEWFNNVPGVNYKTCRNITFQRSNDGQWVFDSYYHPEDPNDPSTADYVFFPIDDFENPNNQKYGARYDKDPNFTGGYGYGLAPGQHNFHFCDETHAQFIYQPGQVFDFRGDDDVWIFINNKLAIDLGGVHPPLSKTINLESEASKLGLTPGEKYDFDLYHCERHTDGSQFRIRTSIFFEQSQGLECN